MTQGSGGEITFRALGPLPDLDSVVFFRSKNRDFVTGQGPFPVSARPWARRFMRIGTWVLLAAGILVSIGVGVAELYEREQWARLESVLKTVDAEVVGCGAGDTTVPFFRFAADGKIINHYPPQTRADICDNRAWQVTYIPGDPDAWAVAPDSPLPPFEDDINAIWIGLGPCLLLVAGLYWLLARMQDRQRVRERRLVAEGGLVGGELLSVKYREGDDSGPSLSVKFRVNLPDGRSIDDKQTLSLFDFTRKTLPPVGSKLLVLWVDEKVRRVL
jgi:hypothetical protein